MSRDIELTAPAAAEGERVDRFVAASDAGLTRSRVAALMRDGLIRVDGEIVRASRRLKGGEVIRVSVPDPGSGGIEPEARPLEILAEDDEWLFLNKAAGMVVHPGAGVRAGTLVHALLAHCGPSLLGVGGEGRPGIVHRLDKGTTGVLVVAKTARAHASLTAQFAARTVAKTYLAVVVGEADARVIEAPIARSATRRTRMAVVTRGRPATTRVRVREAFGRAATLVELDLLTGRTHQARVHLAHAGHPIAGDAAYPAGGGPAHVAARAILTAFPRPALHAWRLQLDHPRTGERTLVEAPVPPDMTALIQRLREATAPRPRGRPPA